MLSLISLGREALVAELTFEWLLARVYLLVQLKIGKVLELLAANFDAIHEVTA